MHSFKTLLMNLACFKMTSVHVSLLNQWVWTELRSITSYNPAATIVIRERISTEAGPRKNVASDSSAAVKITRAKCEMRETKALYKSKAAVCNTPMCSLSSSYLKWIAAELESILWNNQQVNCELDIGSIKVTKYCLEN